MRFTFGSVRVDGGARTVSNAAGTVHLTTKALDLLLLLLEFRLSVVSKDQIYERLWPGTFVTESSIQTLIHEIRDAIDVPGDPSWIRTVRGVGYCFEGHVVASGPPAAAPTSHPAAWLVGDSIRVPLHAGENTVGRAGEGIIEIDAPTISRRHARIAIGDSVLLDDLGSKNGTWLDGERVVESRTVPDGATVRLGSMTFTFRLARPPKPTESIDEVPGGHDGDRENGGQ
jgi:DNA-binding winged helix-turn-helix (wHTH) protein